MRSNPRVPVGDHGGEHVEPAGRAFRDCDRTRGFDRIGGRLSCAALRRDQPKTFPVLVREGSRLSQIRFRRGHAQLDHDIVARLARIASD